MIGSQIRGYEISLWTLQDDFITILKTLGTEQAGHIENPIMKLNVDGTQELSFSIPMYIAQNGTKIENPIWYNVSEKILIASLKKIKVVINKGNTEEKIYEFIITKVTERHEDEQLYCDVECEGLAFHELGKVGYKISLSSDDFYNEDYKWFTEDGNENTQPRATLQYWADKIFTRSVSGESKDLKKWYYEVRMDYGTEISSTIFEEPYATSWTENGSVDKTKGLEEGIEKERLLDLEESNKYNLSQELAEKFGVYCKYEYEHDKNYHISGRKVIFYNSFLEEDNFIDLNYKYQSSSITREMDGTDIVTKMYVRPVNNSASGSGWSTIMDAIPNKSKEDYLLNFDYLYTIGTIDEDQYNNVKYYETLMRNYNLQLEALENRIIDYESRLPEVEAKLNVAKNAVLLDQERITDSNKLLNQLTGGDGYIEITQGNPKRAVLIEDKSANNGSYYFRISEHGIYPGSLHVYKEIQSVDNTLKLETEIKTCKLNFDEFNNLEKVTNIFLNSDDQHIVYLTYRYEPKLYYENIKKRWVERLAKDQADEALYQQKYNYLSTNLNDAKANRDRLLSYKREDVANFERRMGAAIREGYWQPDDYSDYGQSYTDSFTFGNFDSHGASGYSSWVWDSAKEDEQQSYYVLDVTQTKYYYPYIEINDNALLGNEERLTHLSLLFKDSRIGIKPAGNGETSTESATSTTTTSTILPSEFLRAFSINSELQYAFINKGTIENPNLVPIVLITGYSSLSEAEIANLKETAFLGRFTTTDEDLNEHIELDTDSYIDHGSLVVNWNPSPYNIYYPRIKILSPDMIIDEKELVLMYNNTILQNYEDYVVTSEIVSAESAENIRIWGQKEHIDALQIYENGNAPVSSTDGTSLFTSGGNIIEIGNSYYYITIKPLPMLLQGLGKQTQIMFTLSNANTSIYLDAIEVLKDSSRPRVSYTIAVSAVDDSFIKTDYKLLNRIAHINDYELKFKNVLGYISEVVLHLDEPWEDELEIKNYKTKFEDLFTTIVAQTEQMKKTSYMDGVISQAFTGSGAISPNVLKNSIMKADLNYAFNNGKLIIDEKNGIWGISDSGVVAFRGGGIFTASEKDGAGNWIWNTGILPIGINANLITTGQLDTNKIKVYAGDQLRFQLNGDGLFAYKSFFDDFEVINKKGAASADARAKYVERVNNSTEKEGEEKIQKDIDAAQYVVLNPEGLFLKLENGAYVLNKEKTDYIKIGDRTSPPMRIIVQRKRERTIFNPGSNTESAVEGDLRIVENSSGAKSYYEYSKYTNSDRYDWFLISAERFSKLKNEMYIYETTDEKYTEENNRVEISWNGLILRNLYNDEVFYADPDTGNLYLKGTVFADSFLIKSTENGTDIPMPIEDYLNSHIHDRLIEVRSNLKEIFDEAAQVVSAASSSVNEINKLNLINSDILNGFKNDIAENMTPEIVTGTEHQAKFKPGDIWEKTKENSDGTSTVIATYVATAYWDQVYSNETEAKGNKSSTKGWTRTHDYSLAAITGASLAVDAQAGTVDITGQNQININTGKTVNITARGKVNINGNEEVNIGGTRINICALSSNEEAHLGGIHLLSASYNATDTDKAASASKIDLDANGITLASKNGIEIASGAGINIKSGDPQNISVVSIDKGKGVWLGSNKSITFFSGASDPINKNGASVEINKERIIFGLSNTESGTAVEMNSERILLAAKGNKKITTGNGIQYSDDIPYELSSSRNNLVSGVDITKDKIHLVTSGTVSGNNTISSIKMDVNGIDLANVTRSDTADSGSYIKIGKEISIASADENNASAVTITPELVNMNGWMVKKIGNSTYFYNEGRNNYSSGSSPAGADVDGSGIVFWTYKDPTGNNDSVTFNIYKRMTIIDTEDEQRSKLFFTIRPNNNGDKADFTSFNFFMGDVSSNLSDGSDINNYIAYYSESKSLLISLDSIELNADFYQSIYSGIKKSIYIGVDTEENLPDITNTTSIEDGTLGIVYPSLDISSEPKAIGFSDSSEYDFSPELNNQQNKSGHRFDIKNTGTELYWNVYGGTDADDKTYSRAGTGHTISAASATCKVFIATTSSTTGAVLNINFDYTMSNGSTWSVLNKKDVRSGGIIIRCLDSKENIVGEGSFTPASNRNPIYTGTLDGKASLTLTDNLQTDKKLYVVFYSKITNTLIFIRPNSISVTTNTTTTEAVKTWKLYAKYNGAWNPLAISGDSGSPTTYTGSYSISVNNTNNTISAICAKNYGLTILTTGESLGLAIDDSKVYYTSNYNNTNGILLGILYLGKNNYGIYGPTSSSSGGSGSTVSYSPTLLSGTKIGTLTIDGTENILYAPSSSGGTAYSGSNSITISGTTISVKCKTGGGLTVDSNGLGINVGDGLFLSSTTNKIYLDEATIHEMIETSSNYLNLNDYYFLKAGNYIAGLTYYITDNSELILRGNVIIDWSQSRNRTATNIQLNSNSISKKPTTDYTIAGISSISGEVITGTITVTTTGWINFTPTSTRPSFGTSEIIFKLTYS